MRSVLFALMLTLAAPAASPAAGTPRDVTILARDAPAWA